MIGLFLFYYDVRYIENIYKTLLFVYYEDFAFKSVIQKFQSGQEQMKISKEVKYALERSKDQHSQNEKI